MRRDLEYQRERMRRIRAAMAPDEYAAYLAEARVRNQRRRDRMTVAQRQAEARRYAECKLAWQRRNRAEKNRIKIEIKRLHEWVAQPRYRSMF